LLVSSKVRVSDSLWPQQVLAEDQVITALFDGTLRNIQEASFHNAVNALLVMSSDPRLAVFVISGSAKCA